MAFSFYSCWFLNIIRFSNNFIVSCNESISRALSCDDNLALFLAGLFDLFILLLDSPLTKAYPSSMTFSFAFSNKSAKQEVYYLVLNLFCSYKITHLFTSKFLLFNCHILLYYLGKLYNTSVKNYHWVLLGNCCCSIMHSNLVFCERFG